MDSQTAQQLVKAGATTAFVVGNGPSLRHVTLSSLDGYATFGLNAAYRFWREIDWRPSHYACLDLVVGMSHREAIANLIEEGRIQNFLLRSNLIEALGAIGRNPAVADFDAMSGPGSVFSGPTLTTGSGAALWASSLGFRQIVLLGIDGRYKQLVEGAEKRAGIELEIVKNGDNPNYFFDGYQQPGDRYNVPDPRPNLHLDAWRETAARLGSLGVDVYNGNDQSAVRCFPFIDLGELLNSGAEPRPQEETTPRDDFAPGVPETGADRFNLFIRHNGVLAAGLGVLFAAAAFVLARIGGPATGFVAAAVLAISYAISMALLYTRFVVSAKLRELKEESASLRARLAALERSRRVP